MSGDLHGLNDYGWAGTRNFIVPPDIVAVPRKSPIRPIKRTPLRPRPEGEPIARAGDREWFSDHLFVEPGRADAPTACGASMTMHASCLIGVVVVLMTQSEPLPPVRMGPSLVMPAMVSIIPVPGQAFASAQPSSTPEPPPATVKQPTTAPPAPAPPPPLAASAPAPAPIEAPSSITPETGNEGRADGVEGGVAEGSDGGVLGGVVGGIPGGLPGGRAVSGSGSSGALRLGAGMVPPRKTKDVKPIYPSGALSDQARGAVVLEAIVNIDGKVEDAKVIRSIPQLDQAAIDAVRQWEFVPARLNGSVVAVIITVIVNFAVY
jgi:protein TonB